MNEHPSRYTRSTPMHVTAHNLDEHGFADVDMYVHPFLQPETGEAFARARMHASMSAYGNSRGCLIAGTHARTFAPCYLGRVWDHKSAPQKAQIMSAMGEPHQILCAESMRSPSSPEVSLNSSRTIIKTAKAQQSWNACFSDHVRMEYLMICYCSVRACSHTTAIQDKEPTRVVSLLPFAWIICSDRIKAVATVYRLKYVGRVSAFSHARLVFVCAGINIREMACSCKRDAFR